MRKLKSNITFNFLGIAWLGLLTLAVTPIQVHLLGIEAFGFIGLITVLQVLLGTLDLGLSATVTKVISSDHSERHGASANAVNSASTAYWFIALLIAGLLWMNAEQVAGFWLSRTMLDPATVTLGIQIIAVYLGLRWPIAFYVGVINGLQRMDILNLIRVGVHTLRLVGGVVVLLICPDLVAFLVWFALSSLVELLVYGLITYSLLPTLRLSFYFSLVSLKDIWKYSAKMNLIAIASLILSQADRLAVTKLLSLEALGYYSVVYNASSVISLLQSAINSASFPAFSYSFSKAQHAELLSRYNRASELMAVVVALPCFLLVFFSREILQFWISTEVADEAAWTMVWLAIGFFLNAIVSSAYTVAVACGQPNLPLKISLQSMVLYIPALYWLVNLYGISGAAAAWAGLNAFYVLTLIPSVQAKVMNQDLMMSVRANLLPSIIAGVGAFGGAKLLSFLISPGWQVVVMMIFGALMYVAIVLPLVSGSLRKDLSNLTSRFRYLP
jgi:O-antigen/teichoic acid export membrane protein